MPKIIESIRSVLQLFLLQCYLPSDPFVSSLQLQKHPRAVPLVLRQTSQLHFPQFPRGLSLYCNLFLQRWLFLQEAAYPQPDRIQPMLIGIGERYEGVQLYPTTPTGE